MGEHSFNIATYYLKCGKALSIGAVIDGQNLVSVKWKDSTFRVQQQAHQYNASVERVSTSFSGVVVCLQGKAGGF